MSSSSSTTASSSSAAQPGGKSSGGGVGDVDIRLHPLVVLSAADHHARTAAQESNGTVLGAMFGVQTGRLVHVYDSFEIALRVGDDGQVRADVDAFGNDVELYKQAYPDYEVLGWYTTGSRPLANHSRVHEQMTKFNENPLFMMLDPNCDDDAKELPIMLYMHMLNDKSETDFVPVAFQIHSDEAERISALHVVKVADDHNEGSTLAPHLQSLRKAVMNLRQRVLVLKQFLLDVKSGKVKPEQHQLRAIKSVCNRLPTLDSAMFADNLVSEYNDALLVTYMASITKGNQLITQAMGKFEKTYMQGGSRGGGRGGMRF